MTRPTNDPMVERARRLAERLRKREAYHQAAEESPDKMTNMNQQEADQVPTPPRESPKEQEEGASTQPNRQQENHKERPLTSGDDMPY